MNDQPKFRILIVDDDEASVHMLQSVFQGSRFEAMIAFDGLEGLDIATKHLPDVILTGIVMPRMSGFDMIRNLQNGVSTAKIPVLVYSHLGREDDRDEAVQLGVRGFFIRGMTTPNEIVEQARQAISPEREFYLELDPSRADAKELAQTFPIKHTFTCHDGKELVVKLESLSESPQTLRFKATLICGETYRTISDKGSS